MIHGMKIDHRIEYIDHPQALDAILRRISNAPVIALDIETIDWWKRGEERISILQLGFREEKGITVAIVDLLCPLDPEQLRPALEWGLQVKAIHNAAFDAVRLDRHFGIRTSPIHDTMLASRRSGQKQNSLRDLSRHYFGIELEKAEQRSDWRRRPLTDSQLHYAALDAVCTLLLYEAQRTAGLVGTYHLRASEPRSQAVSPSTVQPRTVHEQTSRALPEAIAQIVTNFPDRYTPLQLAVAVTSQRSGIVGWILDQHSIPPINLPESSSEEQTRCQAEVRSVIDTLCQEGRLELSESGRLTVKGAPEPC
jgi:hypothetical protein